MCGSLGVPERAVTALDQSLPDARSYQLTGRLAGAPVSEGKDTYTASCPVWGNGRILLNSRTELLMVDGPERWWPEEVSGSMNPRKMKSFTAGSQAVSTGNRAAILVPSASPGKIPGGTYSMSVVVHLTGGKYDARTEEALKNLAIGAASFSHKKAGCDLPSRLPDPR